MLHFLNRLTKYLLTGILYLFFSCQKEIKVDLPEPASKIVVDGRIELGLAPYVMITHNKPYFGTDLNDLPGMFIHDAVVKVSNGSGTLDLNEFCSMSLPDSMLLQISEFTGVNVALLKTINICIYTTLSPALKGEVGKTYKLTVIAEGKTITGVTTIFPPVKLDSAWWKPAKDDTLGFIYSQMTDPPAEGNAFRWLSKRIGYDPSFTPPLSSVFDDKMINGQRLEFAYGYYNKGDTVAIKFCSIDQASYHFFRDLETVSGNQGNPFASPASVPTTLSPKEDVLGVWCGYGFYEDTVICR